MISFWILKYKLVVGYFQKKAACCDAITVAFLRIIKLRVCDDIKTSMPTWTFLIKLTSHHFVTFIFNCVIGLVESKSNLNNWFLK